MSLIVQNVHLPYSSTEETSSQRLYNVICIDGVVHRIEDAAVPDRAYAQVAENEASIGKLPTVDAGGKGILLPALCHAHIHLDKCFLLDQCDELITGDFAEALTVTAKAKRAFPSNTTDLYNRGKRLITESVECGVTAMRAHVEVDGTVLMSCVDVGLALKRDFAQLCDVQIAVFAQDPLYASAADTEPGENLALLCAAAKQDGVAAVGSAPYVEQSTAHAKRNIAHVLDLAHAHALHADFHLDYTLDAAAEPLVWALLDELRTRVRAGCWRAGARVCVGHATRLALFGADEWARLRRAVEDEGLPVVLVGLPPSDVYMMGRGARPLLPRGTLDVPRLAREHALRAALAVNNVGNAFTPQGPVDPLALCPLGVALFQAGTRRDCAILVEAITLTARTAIGMRGQRSLVPAEGDVADFVLLPERDSLYAAALDPSHSRVTIKGGVVVAERRVTRWLAS